MAKIIQINGIVGREVKASQVQEQINAANGDDIVLQVNSVGGLVYEGFQIFNAIKKATGKVTAEITGVCASIASYLVLASDEIKVEKNSMFMIHNAYVLAAGDHKSLRKIADGLEHNSGILAEQYSKKTGKSINELKSMMDKETFIYGDEIVSQGFADSIFEDDEAEAKGYDASLASAKMQIEYCAAEMKADEMASQDLEKAAAYLQGITQHASSVKPAVKAERPNPKTTPQTNQTGDKMTLEEFLAQNPEAKAKYDAEMKAQYDAGEAKQKATLEVVAPYLKSDSAYGAAVRDLALKAVSGEVTKDSVLSTVATLDAIKEQQASGDAADDSDANKDTPADQGGAQASADGIVRNAVDEAAAIAKLKQN